MARRLIIFSIVGVIILGLGYAGVRFGLAKYREYKEEQIRKQLSFQILEGATASAPVVVEVDYKKQISTGSPLIFGGSHTPPLDHEDAWNKLSEIGLTSVRKDLYVEFTLPTNISADEYFKNNNLQNPDYWNEKTIHNVKKALKKIKTSYHTTIGIMAYAPSWLTHNNSPHGTPTNWDIYEDIVKKIYFLYRNDLDYIEIWNEPDHKTFLITDGSNLSRAEAYNNIYYHASKAIREVDRDVNDGKVIPIGAAVESNPKVFNILENILSDKKINIKPDFISFHNYDDSYTSFYEVYDTNRKKYLKPNTPIFITEWNKESAFQDVSEYKTGNKAIMFTSNRFINYLKDSIAGANYFALLPINTSNRGTNENTMGFYRWENGKAELLPQAKTWRILSKSMGLGAGESRVMETTHPDTINSIGFINSKGEEGVAIVNDSGERQLVELNLNNGNVENRARIDVYFASELYDGGKPVHSHVVEMLGKDLKYRLIVPRETVAGIKITPEHRWYDFIDKLVE